MHAHLGLWIGFLTAALAEAPAARRRQPTGEACNPLFGYFLAAIPSVHVSSKKARLEQCPEQLTIPGAICQPGRMPRHRSTKTGRKLPERPKTVQQFAFIVE